MALLPPVENGKLLLAEDGDRKAMEQVLEWLPMIKQVHVKRLVRNEGWTLRKALEHVGVMICERKPRERKVTENDHGEQEGRED